MATVHLIISGKVQGVFYRASAKEKADELHLTGWIKNMLSGEVEAVVTGADEVIQQFIEWCWQGPKRAQVTNVKITNRSDESFHSFNIRR